MEVSLRTVASASVYSLCTVSKALRGDPKIPQATRKKVKGVADCLGYRPNAALSRVSNRKTGRGSSKSLEPLAFVHGMAPGLLRPPRMSEVAIAGAKERAHALGYRLEVYD